MLYENSKYIVHGTGLVGNTKSAAVSTQRYLIGQCIVSPLVVEGLHAATPPRDIACVTSTDILGLLRCNICQIPTRCIHVHHPPISRTSAKIRSYRKQH
jgi:hypothetical protein